MTQFDNRRILVVDDEASMHEDFRGVLASPNFAGDNAQFSQMEQALFGDAPRLPTPSFVLTSAYQGEEALVLAREALLREQPFAVAIVDMRMPPGWDGLRTVEELWSLDARLQIVLCTAYSDHSWQQLLNRLDSRDRLLVVMKPFDPVEVWQCTSALSVKWSLARQTEARIETLERQLTEHERNVGRRCGPQAQVPILP